MNPKFKLSRKAWLAIGFVLAFYSILTVSGSNLVDAACYAVLGISVAGVAAFDSMHIRLRRYKTWLSYGPVGLFVVCALVWPVVIVWYFIVRFRIERGTMPLRDEYRQTHVAA